MKQKTFSFTNFAAGFMTGAIVFSLIGSYNISKVASGSPTSVATSTTESNTDKEEDKPSAKSIIYNTSQKNWNVTLESGEKLSFNTPEGFYSLSDQYLENLKSYYKVDEDTELDSQIVVCGDDTSPYNSNTLINADSISDVGKMLSQLNGSEYKESDLVYSEAYTYMKTGKIPDNAADNYKIKEVSSPKIDDIQWHIYKVEFDTTYEAEDAKATSGDAVSDELDGTVVHTEQLCAYTETDDAMEVIIYMSDFDQKKALATMNEFLGVD